MRDLWVMYLLSGLVLSVLSLPLVLGKIPPNQVYGFRVPATLGSPEIWYAVNRYAGKWLLGAGTAIVLAAVLFYLVPGMTLDTYAIAVLLVVVVALTATVAASLIYLRQLRRRTQ